jgi:hypothetical protein
MARVSTVHLSPDATSANARFGPTDARDVGAVELHELLERFREIDPLQLVDAEPQVIITGRAGRFIVRTSQKKLFLYGARDAAQAYAELSPAEIVQQVEASDAAPGWADEASAESDATRDGAATLPQSAPHRGIAAAILITGIALNGYTLYSVFYTESVNPPPVVTLLTEPAELAARQQAVVGTYATGDKPGDRSITVLADGRIKFVEIGSANGVLNNTDTYRLGRRGDKLCLTTADSGVIDIFDTDTLVYYRDFYRRK